MKVTVASILIALFLVSCAPSIPYSADYPMTQSVFRSRDGMFSGLVPAGWFSSTEDSLASALAVWIISEDYSATLSVKELKLDLLTAEHVRRDGLKLLASLNAAWEHHGEQVREMKEYKMNGRLYCGYALDDRESPGRVVVFSEKDRYYACMAQRVTGRSTGEELRNMFRAQQTMLGSLRF